MFIQFTQMDGSELWLREELIESYRVQDCGRGSVITTNENEEILVRESNRYITHALQSMGYLIA